MHIVHQLGIGGAENGVINLVNHLNPEMFDVSICAFTGFSHQTDCRFKSKIWLFRLGKKSGNDLSVPIRLWRVLKKWKPDIIHTHSWGTLCERIIGGKLARTPVVVHGEHGTIQQKPINVIIQRIFWR